MTVLVCPCGARIKAPGAVPGRVGRCPECGGRIRVPDVPTPVEPEPAPIPDPPAPPPRKVRSRKPPRAVEPPGRFGLVAMPARIERSFLGSLPYPLWDTGGLALLIVFPPVLLVLSMLSFGLRSYITSDDDVTRMGSLTLAFPMLCFLLAAVGYAMLFLERVFTTTADGDVPHPRWPGWEPPAVLGALVRWLAAALPGLIVSGALAWLYLSSCSKPIRPYQESIALAILGAGFALLPLPLAAVILHGDARAANPLATLAAMLRAGPGVVGIGLLFGLAGAAFLGVVALLYQLPGPLAGIVGVWLYWLLACYAAMVVMRRLGHFYAPRAEALGWFPERPRWGAG